MESRAHYVNVIRKKAKRDREAAMTDEERKIAMWNDLYNTAASMQERVKNILFLANECKRNEIAIPEEEYRYGYEHGFFASGITHHVGLTANCDRITIRNGGFCGMVDFYINSEDIWALYGEGCDKGKRADIRALDLEKFISEFPVFEAAFYTWLDSLEEE